MTRPLLRERIHGHHARVTNVELFFDLVFVFAITQLSHSLLAHLDVAGVVRVGMLMLAVWWVWVFTAWITNWLDPERVSVRTMLFVLMAIGLVMTTSLPDAFGARAIPFAVAYASMQVGRSLFMMWASRHDESLCRNFLRITSWLATAAVFWIAGAFLPEVRLPLWALALGIEYAGPASAFWTPGLGRANTRDWTVEGAHMAERCGLFIIICLGESILVTGATFGQHPSDLASIGAFLAALTAAIAMWWIYFNAHAEAAARAIAESDDPGRIARIAYTYAHIPIVAGIIVTAAGDELALAHPLGHMAPPTAWLIVGGPALFLLGGLWFRHAVFKVISASQAGGLALLGLTALAAPHVTPLALSAATTLALLVVATWETLSLPRSHAAAHD